MTNRIINSASNISLIKSISGPIPYIITAITLPLEFISQNILEKIISLPEDLLVDLIELFSVKSITNQTLSQQIVYKTNNTFANILSTLIFSSDHLIGLGFGFLIDLFAVLRRNISYKNNLENFNDQQIFEILKSHFISNFQNHNKYLEKNQNLFLKIIDNPNELSSFLISMNLNFLDDQIKSLAISFALLKNINEDEIKSQLESMIGVDSIKHQINIIKEQTTYLMKMGIIIYKVANNEIDIQYFAQQYSNLLIKVAKQKLICNFSSNIMLILEQIFNDDQVRKSILLDKVTREIDLIKFLLYSTKLKALDLVNKSNDKLNNVLDSYIGSNETDIVDECLIPLTNFLT